jgi:hypothetical protein
MENGEISKLFMNRSKSKVSTNLSILTSSSLTEVPLLMSTCSRELKCSSRRVSHQISMVVFIPLLGQELFPKKQQSR